MRSLAVLGLGAIVFVAYLAGKTDAIVIREPAHGPAPLAWIPVVIEAQPEDNKGEAPVAIDTEKKKKLAKAKAQSAVWKPDRSVIFSGK